MKNFFKNLTMVFSAGCLGGLVNSLALWLSGSKGITAQLGVKLAPALTAQWLYPRVVWGGIWGVLFILPLLKKSYFMRGVLFSLGPSAAQLFFIFPVKAGKGMMGLDLGALTPALVLVLNALWGLTAAYWLKYVRGS
jgi:hypothetical protein